MGGLGHYLEREGIATTQISLIRVHSEKIRPPRALAVPFELGRPLGTPDDPGFQKRVLRAALALLEAGEGPVLADFPERPPGPAPDLTGWACPINLARPAETLSGPERLARALAEEVGRLGTWHAISRERRGRTTVGVSGLEIDAIARFLAAFVGDPATPSPRADRSLAVMLKTASEDLKAYYLEAATAQPGAAPSRALEDWFWGETTAGRVLLALKGACARCPDEAVQRLGPRLVVPHTQKHRLG
ncbi:MAG: hypothetical protein HY521_10790 [Proteobacteria bacterium]|nr:hypothetical protein [Pseudomonadota bacterium]